MEGLSKPSATGVRKQESTLALSHIGPLTCPGLQGLFCLPVYLPPGCLSLALLCPIAPKALAWAEPHWDLEGPWVEELAVTSALGRAKLSGSTQQPAARPGPAQGRPGAEG